MSECVGVCTFLASPIEATTKSTTVPLSKERSNVRSLQKAGKKVINDKVNQLTPTPPTEGYLRYISAKNLF